MTTFADFKRRLVPGVLLGTTYPGDPFGKGDPPPRRLVAGKTSLVMEATAWSNGQTSHWQMPKAGDVTIIDDDTFALEAGSRFERRYTIMEDAA